MRALLEILYVLVSLYAVVMLVYCLSTWFIRDPRNRFLATLAVITEPPLRPIRAFLNRFYYFQQSPVDFSSLIFFFILEGVQSLLRLGIAAL